MGNKKQLVLGALVVANRGRLRGPGMMGEKKEKDMLREKSNNPNLKGGEKRFSAINNLLQAEKDPIPGAQ